MRKLSGKSTLGLLSALSIAPAMLIAAPSAHAAGGFTSAFDPSNWDLNIYEGVAVPAPPGVQAPTTPPTPVTTTYPSPSYLCPTPYDGSVSCINDLNAPAGSATLIGSDYTGSAGRDSNGSPNTPNASQWELKPYSGPSPYSFTFKWSYFTGDINNDDQSYYYLVDESNNVTTTLLSSQSSGDNGLESVTLQTGWRLGFGVHTSDNSAGPGYLQITEFNPVAAEVPGPLPLLGAGAAFGWSRRLRKRIGTLR